MNARGIVMALSLVVSTARLACSASLVPPMPAPDPREAAREPCPMVSTEVLKTTPEPCKREGIRAKRERLDRNLQRLERLLERPRPSPP
jgi:hypothetical protein